MKKSGSQKPQRVPLELPFEVSAKSDRAGTFILLAPEDLSRELNALPSARQDEIRKIIHRRMAHLILIFIGLLKHPGAEKDFGHELDSALSELVDQLVDLIHRPTVIH